MQLSFSKSRLFSYLAPLAIAALVMAFDHWLASVDVRSDGPARQAEIRFAPVHFDPLGFAPLRLAGAWRVTVEDSRFGGVSALAIDGDRLLALTDSGTLIRMPLPGQGAAAFVQDLPAGPGTPRMKVDRDSEALTRDSLGRGWWVAFEHWHQLWLYDPGFSRALGRVDLGEHRWPANRGVEALVSGAEGLLMFPEGGHEWLRLRESRVDRHKLGNGLGYVADAAFLPDGRLLVVTRQFGIDGVGKHLAWFDRRRGALLPLASIRLGATDNVEAIAVEPRGNGLRLWLMTDNDFRPRAPTLLVALDLP